MSCLVRHLWTVNALRLAVSQSIMSSLSPLNRQIVRSHYPQSSKDFFIFVVMSSSSPLNDKNPKYDNLQLIMSSLSFLNWQILGFIAFCGAQFVKISLCPDGLWSVMLIFTSEQEDRQIHFVLFLSPTRFESNCHSNWW